MSEIFRTIENVLKQNDSYLSENGDLLKTNIYNDVMNMETDLIDLLLNNETIKERFFIDIGGSLVFDKQEFAWLIESKRFLPDSYTTYSNKIGLTHRDEFISLSKDVVLDFPYKDTVLVGGQDKGDQKREEIFFHEKIAYDEVTHLLGSKVLSNAKRYTPESVEENIEFNEDDNLIIKGNNLIALSSLHEKYEGAVKSVYVDPPYFFENTTSDEEFLYNSNFKLSTWLLFMKNRILQTIPLLTNGGFFIVQMNDSGVFHLKVLLDELFKHTQGGFLNHITVKMSDLSGPKMAHINKKIPKIKEHILIYTNNYEACSYNNVRVKSTWDDAIDSKRYTSFVEKNGSDDTKDWEYTTVRKKLASLGLSYGAPEADEFLMENADCVFRTAANAGLSKLSRSKNFDRTVFTKVTTQTGLEKYVYKGEEVIFATSKIHNIDGEDSPSEAVSDIWSDIALNDLMNEGGVSLKNGKKPESLLRRLLELTTNKNDIVLDYFMGSATTQAVAMKLNRRFIGVEQMNYIEDLSVTRLVNTMKGDKRGISKYINWEGGGSFVYAELKENNAVLQSIIENSTEENIEEIKESIYSDERIIPYLTEKELKKVDEDFSTMNLNRQKTALMTLIDKNKLYVPYSSIDDNEYNISEPDKAFSRSFYEGGDE